MKAFIGPYKTWIGPHQIAQFILFWLRPDEDGKLNDTVYRFGKWLSTNKDGAESRLARVCQWIYDRMERRVKVKIHAYDTWNVDNTLALIILPMLKRYQETKHGAPYTDDVDVPDELKSLPTEHEYDLGANHFKRWDWILDEMIFAFECKTSDWESQTHSTEEYRQIQNRISNGFRLFGKYYEALWD